MTSDESIDNKKTNQDLKWHLRRCFRKVSEKICIPCCSSKRLRRHSVYNEHVSEQTHAIRKSWSNCNHTWRITREIQNDVKKKNGSKIGVMHKMLCSTCIINLTWLQESVDELTYKRCWHTKGEFDDKLCIWIYRHTGIGKQRAWLNCYHCFH